MRIVQSWATRCSELVDLRQQCCRWRSPRHHYLSWILSAFQAQSLYGAVDLVTDSPGKEVLVDTLKLPYSRISTALQAWRAPRTLWSYGKVVAQSIQNDPYLHIDSDVYLWKKFPDRLLSAHVVTQNVEVLSEDSKANLYKRPLEQLRGRVITPPYWKEVSARPAYNCGIAGGNDIDALRRWALDTIDVVENPQNRRGWQELTNDGEAASDWACLIEQFSLKASMDFQGVPVTTLYPNGRSRDRKISREIGYTHVQWHKNDKMIPGSLPLRLEAIVQRKYPKHFELLRNWMGHAWNL